MNKVCVNFSCLGKIYANCNAVSFAKLSIVAINFFVCGIYAFSLELFGYFWVNFQKKVYIFNLCSFVRAKFILNI